MMIMVLVVLVSMLVLGRFMRVVVQVSLGHVQPNAPAHQGTGKQQRHVKRLTERDDRNQRAPNGANEKYAAVRDVPSSRSAYTNNTRLRP